MPLCYACKQPVTSADGAQCKGSCKRWYHFKCIKLAESTLQDVIDGRVEIRCPCPKCDGGGRRSCCEPSRVKMVDCENKNCPVKQQEEEEESKKNAKEALEAQGRCSCQCQKCAPNPYCAMRRCCYGSPPCQLPCQMPPCQLPPCLGMPCCASMFYPPCYPCSPCGGTQNQSEEQKPDVKQIKEEQPSQISSKNDVKPPTPACCVYSPSFCASMPQCFPPFFMPPPLTPSGEQNNTKREENIQTQQRKLDILDLLRPSCRPVCPYSCGQSVSPTKSLNFTDTPDQTSSAEDTSRSYQLPACGNPNCPKNPSHLTQNGPSNEETTYNPRDEAYKSYLIKFEDDEPKIADSADDDGDTVAVLVINKTSDEGQPPTIIEIKLAKNKGGENEHNNDGIKAFDGRYGQGVPSELSRKCCSNPCPPQCPHFSRNSSESNSPRESPEKSPPKSCPPVCFSPACFLSCPKPCPEQSQSEDSTHQTEIFSDTKAMSSDSSQRPQTMPTCPRICPMPFYPFPPPCLQRMCHGPSGPCFIPFLPPPPCLPRCNPGYDITYCNNPNCRARLSRCCNPSSPPENMFNANQSTEGENSDETGPLLTGSPGEEQISCGSFCACGLPRDTFPSSTCTCGGDERGGGTPSKKVFEKEDTIHFKDAQGKSQVMSVLDLNKMMSEKASQSEVYCPGERLEQGTCTDKGASKTTMTDSKCNVDTCIDGPKCGNMKCWAGIVMKPREVASAKDFEKSVSNSCDDLTCRKGSQCQDPECISKQE